jgi:uncharacterized membrane protein YfcA
VFLLRADPMLDATLILQHWWVFPAAIAFATLAIGSGVSGALFFSPFFMFVVGLEPAQAIGAGLLTEVFGMGNGLRSYVRQKVVDYATAKWLLLGAVPAIVAGALLSSMVPSLILKAIFGAGLVVLAGFLLFFPAPEAGAEGEREGPLLRKKSAEKGETVIETRDGEVYRYPTCWRPPGVGMAAGGGLITGMISAGLPEIVTAQLVLRCRVPPRVAIATSVFVLAITAAVGAVVHAFSAQPVWYVVIWSVPGVLIGSAIGSRVGKYLPADLMEKVLGSIFALVGIGVLVLEFVI